MQKKRWEGEKEGVADRMEKQIGLTGLELASLKRQKQKDSDRKGGKYERVRRRHEKGKAGKITDKILRQ